MREELSRNRQEAGGKAQSLRGEVLTSFSTVGESITGKVENLARSNDQRLELVRVGLEQRLDVFNADSSRRLDQLSQSVSDTTGKFQNDVTSQMTDFWASLDRALSENQGLQRE